LWAPREPWVPPTDAEGARQCTGQGKLHDMIERRAMLVAAITGQRQASLIEKPTPRAKDDLVVVRIHATPMCTEYKAYANGRPTDNLGHEAVGEVIEVAQPSRVKRGDRVVAMPLYACGRCMLCLAGDYIYCQQGRDVLQETGQPGGTATYAQYVVKPDWLLLPLPDDLSYLHGRPAVAWAPLSGRCRRCGLMPSTPYCSRGWGRWAWEA